MKARIGIDIEDVIYNPKKLHDKESQEALYKQYYCECYKDSVFDWNSGMVFYDIEIEFTPIEGMRLNTRFGMVTIDWCIIETEPKEVLDKKEFHEEVTLIVVTEKNV